ncbi:MAG: carboxylating nicotinate-nucleotide diphosphorylase [Bacillota bacterium]
MLLNSAVIEAIVEKALKEDLGSGDITTDSIFNADQRGSAEIIARQEGVVAGLPLVLAVFKRLDPQIEFSFIVSEGAKVEADMVLAEVSGRIRSLLSGERTALNFLQHMSAIATKTAAFVEKAAPYNVKILDTRKTVPGLRLLAKYSVKMGGGYNHRFGLYDGALIKDNHIIAAGSIKNAVLLLKHKLPEKTTIEVETETLKEVREALEAGADTIMLDNMSIETMKEAVILVKGKALLEASGGITLATVEGVAETGVDYISVGELTHSVNALDISIEW